MSIDIDGLEFVIETKVETETRHEIKRRFYRFHKFQDHLWGGKKKITTLNPKQIADDTSEDHENWIVVYYLNYHVIVARGQAVLGPHAAKLYFRIGNKATWLGTCQVLCNFYDTKGLKRKLRRAIRNKSYFSSEESAKEELEISSPSEEIFVDNQKKKGKFYPFHNEKYHCPYCEVTRKTEIKLKRHLRIAHRCLSYITKKGSLKVSVSMQ